MKRKYSILVNKFGGSCLDHYNALTKIANAIASKQSEWIRQCIVVSAFKGATEHLISSTENIIGNNKFKTQIIREKDRLLSTGELISASLLTIALLGKGIKAKSFSARQLGIKTQGPHGNSNITSVDNIMLLNDFIGNNGVPVVTGFQGINEANDVTTLGRNSSDYSAVVIAHHINADSCNLYKDVEGLYTGDPRLTSNVNKINELPVNHPLLWTLGEKGILCKKALAYLNENYIKTNILGINNDTGTTLLPKDPQLSA